jgi:hypothetical protein
MEQNGRYAGCAIKRTYFGLARKKFHDVSATSEIRAMYVTLPPGHCTAKTTQPS